MKQALDWLTNTMPVEPPKAKSYLSLFTAIARDCSRRRFFLHSTFVLPGDSRAVFTQTGTKEEHLDAFGGATFEIRSQMN